MPPRSPMARSMPGLSPILAEAERRGEPGAAAWRCLSEFFFFYKPWAIRIMRWLLKPLLSHLAHGPGFC